MIRARLRAARRRVIQPAAPRATAARSTSASIGALPYHGVPDATGAGTRRDGRPSVDRCDRSPPRMTSDARARTVLGGASRCTRFGGRRSASRPDRRPGAVAAELSERGDSVRAARDGPGRRTSAFGLLRSRRLDPRAISGTGRFCRGRGTEVSAPLGRVVAAPTVGSSAASAAAAGLCCAGGGVASGAGAGGGGSGAGAGAGGRAGSSDSGST
jgi:hypothetical protein